MTSVLIGEVAKHSGVSARMLLHYDRVGLVSPTARSSTGYRLYVEKDVRRLFHVEGLRSLGLSLEQVKDVLDDLSFDPAELIADLTRRTAERLASEERLLHRLTQVEASGPGEWTEVLHIIALMRGLDVDDPSHRQRLALSLPGGQARDAVPLAEAALRESDPHAAGAIRWALARTGDAAVPMLADALSSPMLARRHRAVLALIEIDTRAACQVLVRACADRDPLVSGPAALAVGSLAGPTAVPALVALVVAGQHDVAASAVLGDIARDHDCGDEVVATLEGLLGAAEAELRRRIAGALGEIDTPSASRVLMRFRDDDDRGVVLTAELLLAQKGMAASS